MDRILAAYPGYPGKPAVADVAGDHAFWWPSMRVADGHAGTAPTFVYRYDLAPRIVRLVGLDATHAAELVPVFGEVDSPLARLQTVAGGRSALRSVSARMQAHWVHFAGGTASPAPTGPPTTPTAAAP